LFGDEGFDDVGEFCVHLVLLLISLAFFPLAILVNKRYSSNMTIEQTVEIPTDHRLVLEMDIPADVPAGLMGLLTFSVNTDSPESASRQTGRYAPKKIDREKADAAHKRMCGMFKTDGHDVERFLAWKQSERELEWEIDEQRRRNHEKWRKN
jgi:hypothetical protein